MRRSRTIFFTKIFSAYIVFAFVSTNVNAQTPIKQLFRFTEAAKPFNTEQKSPGEKLSMPLCANKRLR